MIEADPLKNQEETCQIRGLGNTKLWEEVGLGTMTPPVQRKNSTKFNRWPLSEIAAINAARIAGWDDDQVRALVKHLVAKRKKLADQLLAEAA